MNSLLFAVASLADATTGHGIAAAEKSTAVGDYSDDLRRGRNIRLQTIAAMFKLIFQREKAVLNGIQQEARRQQKMKQVLNMSDHMLSDIGIEREDLALLRSGQATLETIQQQRKAAAKTTTTPGSLQTFRSQEFDPQQAANEDNFDNPKSACA